MDRRELFPILASIAASNLAAQHEHHKPALVSTDAYKRQVFDDEQNRILDQLADIIIPTDATSPGAHEARVSQYFDLVAAHVPSIKTAFNSGLKDLDRLALQQLNRPLNTLNRESLVQVLEQAAKNEGNPTSGAEEFFELLKFHTVEGYRLSHLGQTQWIGYKPHQPGLYPDLTVE